MRDLTHPLSDETPVYPGDPPVERRPHATHDEAGYRVTQVRFGSHAGTHVDAPAHVLADGATLDEFPVERFAFDARLVDCRDADANDRITTAAVPDSPDCDLLVFRTGWDEHWGTDRYYEHPSLTPSAAERCADAGCDIALDSPSPDPFDAETLPAHRTLFESNRLILENLCNLAGLPDRFRLYAYPLALADADGSPVRAVAEA